MVETLAAKQVRTDIFGVPYPKKLGSIAWDVTSGLQQRAQTFC